MSSARPSSNFNFEGYEMTIPGLLGITIASWPSYTEKAHHTSTIILWFKDQDESVKICKEMAKNEDLVKLLVMERPFKNEAVKKASQGGLQLRLKLDHVNSGKTYKDILALLAKTYPALKPEPAAAASASSVRPA